MYQELLFTLLLLTGRITLIRFFCILVNHNTFPLFSDKNVENSFYAEDDVPYYPNCQCYDDDRGLDCSDDNYRSPPSLLTATQDIMQNITGQSESDYIYYTTDIYRLSRCVTIEFSLNDTKSTTLPTKVYTGKAQKKDCLQ